MSDYKWQGTPFGRNLIRTSDGATVPQDAGNIDYQAYLAWCTAGGVADPAPAVTVDDIVARFLPQLQAWLDGIAQQNHYDSAASCISYVSSGVPQWKADAEAMLAYRDTLWQWAYAQQATLKAMTPAQLETITVEQIIAQAPKAADSGWVVR